MTHWQLTRGATVQPDGSAQFSVWAPHTQSVALQGVVSRSAIPLHRDAFDIYTTPSANVLPGTHYTYFLDGERVRPDPVSRWQPGGVHGPSAVVDPLSGVGF